jgi:co-chaperonin GroES (HSP10)
MNLIPTDNHIIVKAIKPPDTDASGIITTLDTDKERSQQATIITLGKRYNEITNTYLETDLQVGDTVIVLKHAGTDFDDPTKTERVKRLGEYREIPLKLTIIEFEDVQAVIRP